jgi:DNA-binding NtrC family response regulator
MTRVHSVLVVEDDPELRPLLAESLDGAGFAVLDAARRAHASCYVVIITGYASIDVAVQAVRAGAYDLLAKPFALAQLELVLARIKDRMALESENRQLLGNRKAPDAVLIDPVIERRLRALEHRVAALERQ